jgi:hypothetical protein
MAMRLLVHHEQRRRGWLFTRPEYVVTYGVTFTLSELDIIERHRLEETVVLTVESMVVEGGVQRKAYRHCTIADLCHGEQQAIFATPVAAMQFEEVVQESYAGLKELLIVSHAYHSGITTQRE